MKYIWIFVAIIAATGLVSADIAIVRPVEKQVFSRITSAQIEVNFIAQSPINCWYEVFGIKNYTGTVSNCHEGDNIFTLTIFDDGAYTLKIFYLDSLQEVFSNQANFTVLPYVFPKMGVPETGPQENETGCCEMLNQFIVSHLYLNNNLSYKPEEMNNLSVLLTQDCNLKIDNFTAEKMVRGYNLICINITGEIPSFKITPATENQDENFINDGSFAIIVVITITIIIIMFFIIRRFRK